MTLASRIIPVLLCKGRTLVKGTRFVNDRVVGVAMQAAKIHAARGVDELLMIDVAATGEGRTIDLAMVEELTDGNFCPVTVGGGVRTLTDIKALLRAGADKVLIGAAAREDIAFVLEASNSFGSQAIVVALDWPEETVISAVQMAEAGAGEILCNNAQRDGTMEGYDVHVIANVARQVDVPVIACGGCRDYADMASAIYAGASAVAAGALFQFTDATPRGAAQYLADRGIPVRL
jgi:cyclase